MRRGVRGAQLTLIALAALGGRGAAAQEDFRSADLDRPILVEDAIPAKLYEWEFEIGIRGGPAEVGSGAIGIVELKSGLFLNGQTGIELEAGAGEAGEAGTLSGIRSVRGHLLYGFLRETGSWPAVAARLDLSTPGTGSLGLEEWALGVKGMATRSFGRTRSHLNAGYVVASGTDGGDFWRTGIAFDHPIGLFSKAVMGDVYAEIPVSHGRTRVWLEFGTRWQLGNNDVLDFGLATRLDQWDAGNANVQFVLGISRLFGISAFVPVSDYPNPSLR